MNNLNKTSTQVLIEETANKSKLEGKLEEKFEIAKNMIKTLINIKDEDVVSITGLSISQVQQLRVNI